MWLEEGCCPEFGIVLTKAVSSCGLEISDVLTTGFDGLGAAAEAPVVDTGLIDALDGVTVDVTFRGSAAEDGGGITGSQSCIQPSLQNQTGGVSHWLRLTNYHL